jgi:cobalt/nickel transport protein
MKITRAFVLGFLIVVLHVGSATAHVQIMVPDRIDGATVTLDIRWVGHAVDNGPVLAMGRPNRAGVLVNGKRLDLTDSLRSVAVDGHDTFSLSHTMTEPGAHVYYLEPSPYWDAGENVLITHYTKVIVDSTAAKLATDSDLGWENWEGWDALVGFPVEIAPLVQPTSLWTGSVFRGIVLRHGEPAPGARIEVEYLDRDSAVKLPSNAFKTQILKTGSNGEFSFVPVREGWWALTALPDMNETAKAPDGTEVDAEIGGVLWIHVKNME